MTYEKKKVLITVKTYPHPSATYQELVCTAGVLGDGSFIRLYPVDFRTHFFVGTVLSHGTWVILGVFWPKKER